MKTQVLRWIILCVVLFVAGFLITVIVVPGYAQSDGQQETVDAAVGAYFTQTALAYEDLVLSATARPEYNIAQTATRSFVSTVAAQFQTQVAETVEADYLAALEEAETLAEDLSLTRITLDNFRELSQVYALDGKNPVTDAEFSLSSRWLATGHENGDVIIWDLQTGDVAHLLASHETAVSAVMFSPDGRFLATGDTPNAELGNATVRIWDTATGQQLHLLYGYRTPIVAMVFSSDGLQLITLSQSGRTLLWNTLAGELLYTLEPSTLGREYIAIGIWRNGDTVVTVDGGFNMRMFELPNTEGFASSLNSPQILRRFTSFWWDVAAQREFYNLRGELLFTTNFVQGVDSNELIPVFSRLLAVQEANYMIAIVDEGIVKIMGVFSGSRANEVASATAVQQMHLTATAAQMNEAATATAAVLVTNIAATHAARDSSECPGTIVEDQGDILRIVRSQPDLDLTIAGAVRAGMEIEVRETRENEDGVWYEIYEGTRRIGWVQAQYVVLACE